VPVMAMPSEQTRRTDLVVAQSAMAVDAGPPAVPQAAELLSALAAVIQQAQANGTGTPGPPRIDIPTAASVYPPGPLVHRNTASGASGTSGYTAQHTFFQYESARQQGMAYARSIDQKGNVKGILCFHPEGRVTCQTIGVSNDRFESPVPKMFLRGKQFLWTSVSHMQS
jgi:hypothetical protein